MTKIYKNPTHTNRYLNFNSAHSMSQKKGLGKCLLKRAQSQLNSKRTNETLETSTIMEALKNNDYSKWFLKRTVNSLKRKTNSSLANSKEIKTHIVLPYVSRYFEALSKILRNAGILVCSQGCGSGYFSTASDSASASTPIASASTASASTNKKRENNR